jgi:hypothetical protein
MTRKRLVPFYSLSGNRPVTIKLKMSLGYNGLGSSAITIKRRRTSFDLSTREQCLFFYDDLAFHFLLYDLLYRKDLILINSVIIVLRFSSDDSNLLGSGTELPKINQN